MARTRQARDPHGLVSRATDRTGGADDHAGLPSAEELKRYDDRDRVALRRRYADWLLRLLIAQLAVADVVFVLYAALGREWRLSTGVVDSWLAATFLEVTGIVVLVVKYLFPPPVPVPLDSG